MTYIAVRRGQAEVRINPETDSLSSLGFGHGDTIEAHLSGSWTAEVKRVSDKQWDDLSGSDPTDSDDDCVSLETEKVYHSFPAVYDDLDTASG